MQNLLFYLLRPTPGKLVLTISLLICGLLLLLFMMQVDLGVKLLDPNLSFYKYFVYLFIVLYTIFIMPIHWVEYSQPLALLHNVHFFIYERYNPDPDLLIYDFVFTIFLALIYYYLLSSLILLIVHVTHVLTREKIIKSLEKELKVKLS